MTKNQYPAFKIAPPEFFKGLLLVSPYGKQKPSKHIIVYSWLCNAVAL